MIAVNGYFSTLKKTCIELMMIVNGGSGGEPRNYEWRNRSVYFLSWGCLGILDINLLLSMQLSSCSQPCFSKIFLLKEKSKIEWIEATNQLLSSICYSFIIQMINYMP